MTLTGSFVLPEQSLRGLLSLLSLGMPSRQDLVGQGAGLHPPAAALASSLPSFYPLGTAPPPGPPQSAWVVCPAPPRFSAPLPRLSTSGCADLRDSWSPEEPRPKGSSSLLTTQT